MKIKKALLGLVLASTVAVGILIMNDGNLSHKIHGAAGEIFPPINKDNVITTPFENA